MELLIEKSPYYAKSHYNDGFSAIVITRFHCTMLVLVQYRWRIFCGLT